MPNNPQQKKESPMAPSGMLLFLFQVLVIIAAVGWIFVPVLHGGWLMDDDAYFSENPLLHDPARLWKAWFQPGSFVEYYPIEQTVQWLQWQLWHTDTLGYHVSNLLLHIVSALLVWRLLRKFGLQFAWLGGLLFAIHPVMVESVAWISEFKNALSLPPLLLAMWAWLNYEDKGRARDYFLALGFFLVAMLCKISMAPFPAVILLYAWWKRGRISWSDLRTSAPFWVVAVALSITTDLAGVWFRQLHPQPGDVVAMGGLSSRVACAGLSLSFYVWDCLWPVGLLPVYPKWNVDPPSLVQFLPWPVLGVLLFWLWSRRATWGRHALLGLGFFLIMLGPFLGLNAISYMSFTWVMDHFLYIPILGLIGLIVAGLEPVNARFSPPLRRCGIGLVVVVMVLLTRESHSYAGKFVDQEILWTYTLQSNPGAWPAHNNLGKVLMQKGLIQPAIDNFREALRIRPDYAEAQNNWGNALAKTGQLQEAVQHFQEALRIKPGFAEVHCNWGSALVRMGRIPEAIGHYQEALRDDPAFAPAHYDWGNALVHSGQYDEAIVHYQEALRLNPDYADARNNLGGALLRLGRPRDALEQFLETLRLDPNNVSARNNLEQLRLSGETTGH